ncbi:hypothetical protein HOLleu_18404 [Holothuria leucospilota]|uniref:Reverse transcriptase zinc-binding domain-containing protein n=1 Tax=Holothuria leucospilota TaxID=206669 RepID=A0A9Q1H9U6_HOLLE|nr:hypothetical protein HOLleu_18404 [Holothuria leucospilota]
MIGDKDSFLYTRASIEILFASSQGRHSMGYTLLSLATNHLLFLMNKRENNLCTSCNLADESFSHLFGECGITSTVLLDIGQIILGQQFIFTKEDVFFGFKLNLLHPYNFLTFHIKYYIFSQKIKEEVPNVKEFCTSLNLFCN